MNQIKIVLYFLILIKQTLQQSDGNNIVFDLADLTVDYQTDNGWISLEAFKSSINDLIIQTSDKNKYGQLNWLSIGYPKLILTPDPINKSLNEIFKFKPEGFYIRVEMLTNLKRNLFKDVVYRKYNINITKEQIVSLVPSRFECLIDFYFDDKRLLITGRVKQFNTFPLKIEFTAPLNTKERTSLEKRIKEDGNNLDLNIDCEINSKGRAYRQNTLIITGDQLYNIGLIDDLFGPHTERYVTRRQMVDLTTEIYLKLNIIEDYHIPESQFKENFINDFITQAAEKTFQSVPIDDVLNSLSQFNFKNDLKPDVILQDLGKIFSIKNTGNKEQIIADKENFENFKKNSQSNTAGLVDGSLFLDIFDASASFHYAKEKSSDWTKSSSSFDSQLKDLNDFNENNFEWTRIGELIKPKKIKVVKLVKSFMSRNLVFNRVKRDYYDAPFKRVISLNTFNNVYLSSKTQESAQCIENLENLNLEVKKNFKDLNDEFKKFKDEFSLYFSNSDRKSQLLVNDLESIKNRLLNSENKLNGIQISRMQTGILSFTGILGTGHVYSKNSVFNPPFQNIPQMFFTITNLHIVNNVAPLWNIVDLKVYQGSWKCNFAFWGYFNSYALDIQWVALGN